MPLSNGIWSGTRFDYALSFNPTAWRFEQIRRKCFQRLSPLMLRRSPVFTHIGPCVLRLSLYHVFVVFNPIPYFISCGLSWLGN